MMITCFIRRTIVFLLVVLLLLYLIWLQLNYFLLKNLEKISKFHYDQKNQGNNDISSFNNIRKTWIRRKIDFAHVNHDEIYWYTDDDRRLNYEESLNFQDFEKYLENRKRANKKIGRLNDAYSKHFDEKERTKYYCKHELTLGETLKHRYRTYWSQTNSWRQFYYNIGNCDLYRPDEGGSMKKESKVVDNLLKDMAEMEIKYVKNIEAGTQVKFEIFYENGHKAVFKPMRFGRNYETHPNHFYFTDFERHNAEIATFHLDRLLGFRRILPTVGRLVNISDLWQKAEYNLSRTFFVSFAKNLCFVGMCKYYCDTTHAICGRPEMVEGSFQVYLPSRKLATVKIIPSPYARTYSKTRQEAEWQVNDTYCLYNVKNSDFVKYERRLLDLVDSSILDFLTGNQDRHHFETFSIFKRPIYFLHLDNGRGFGKTNSDDLDILAPLIQCCVIRSSTLSTLLNFFYGPYSLSRALNQSLAEDPLAPILALKHFPALERRLETILEKVQDCVVQNEGHFSQVVKKEA